MATEVKISELPAAGAITGAETVVVNQNSITKKTDIDDIKTYILADGASGTFLSGDTPQKTITVVDGLITSIV